MRKNNDLKTYSVIHIPSGMPVTFAICLGHLAHNDPKMAKYLADLFQFKRNFFHEVCNLYLSNVPIDIYALFDRDTEKFVRLTKPEKSFFYTAKHYRERSKFTFHSTELVSKTTVTIFLKEIMKKLGMGVTKMNEFVIMEKLPNGQFTTVDDD